MTVADTVYNFHPPELQWLLVAKTYRSDHARRMSALPSTSDSLAAMSGLCLIASGLHLPPQPIDATQALNLSAGVSNSSVLRGRSFSCRATLFR